MIDFNNVLKKWMVAGAIVFASGSAFAAEEGSIELKATAEKVIVVLEDDGTESTKLVAPEIVVPGDKIAYTIGAKNVGSEEVERVVITDPIPEQMLLVPGTESSEGANVLYSVDGGHTFGLEGELTVLGENGVPRPAISSDYSHIRWVFETPLAPTAERSVRFVALVE
ncbi:MAG: hypothetical protein AB8G23_18955 [Myxococcota bacterium]